MSCEGVPDGLLVVLGVVLYEGQLDVVRLQDVDRQEAGHAVASDQTKHSYINFNNFFV
jgi:hypothetical protein